MGQGNPGDPGDLGNIFHLEHKEYPNKTWLSRALMGSGELHVLKRGGGGGAKGPLCIFKSNGRRVKIQTALERSRRTLQATIMLTLFFTCNVTGRSNKVKLYWFTVANCLSRKIKNLPNKMELSKHKYHRSDLGMASWTISKTCDVIREVNIDQSEDSLVNLTNQRSDCENYESGQEASHTII